MIDGAVRDRHGPRQGAQGRDRRAVESTASTNWLRKAPNVTLIEGHGRFESPRTIRVNDRLLEAPEIFINTGGRPTVPDDGGSRRRRRI